MIIASNSTDPNVVQGAYLQIANNADGLLWQNGITVNLSDVPGVNNDANFGVRIVNAATGGSEFPVTGTGATPAVYTAATGGNWRFDNVQIISSAGAAAPAITTQPTNQSVPAGSGVTFTAVASGIPTPSVQWYSEPMGGTTFTAISGATSSTYSFTTSSSAADNGTQYEAVFTNASGVATTNPATLTDTLAAPTITTQPTPVSTTAGLPVTFTAAASGSPVPTVQWQSSPDNSTWTNISGATSSSYTIPAATTNQNGTYFRALFSNSQAPSGVATSSATLTVTGTLITAWNFNNLASGGFYTSPAASTGTGTASSLGMTQVPRSISEPRPQALSPSPSLTTPVPSRRRRSHTT